MSINSVLSKKLQVKPLESNQNVTYRVKGAGIPLPNVTDENGNKKMARPYVDLDGEYFLRDKFSDSPTVNKQIIHSLEANSVTLPSGEVQLVPIKKRVQIDGVLTFNATTDHETYVFLERHPNNGSNPFRDVTKPIKFSRVDASKEKKKKIKDVNMIDTAIFILRDADKAETISIAKHINGTLAVGGKINLDQELSLIKGDIRTRIVDKTPELVILGSSNTSEKKKIQMQIAESFNVIEFNEDSRTWHFSDKVVATSKVGEDRYVSMISALENASLYGNIIKTTKTVKG